MDFKVCLLFVKCFGNPHSGESEVIHLHVLPQSARQGGCQCISLNRKVPLTPISPLQYTPRKNQLTHKNEIEHNLFNFWATDSRFCMEVCMDSLKKLQKYKKVHKYKSTHNSAIFELLTSDLAGSSNFQKMKNIKLRVWMPRTALL